MPKKCWPRLALLLLLAASGSNLRADSSDRFTIKVFGAGEGLPQSVVMTMAQTRDGFLWLGTFNGLARFDGLNFTRFGENNTPGLNSSRIVKLFEDSRRTLWIGTENAGIVVIKDGVVSSLDTGRTGPDDRLMAACEDQTGGVWLYTADGSLSRYREGKAVPDVWHADSGRPSNCRALIADEAGLLWVGTDWSLAAIGPIPSASVMGLPAQEVPIGRLNFLLASERGGHWRLANGRIQKWRGNRIERDLGPYLWDTNRITVTAACEDREGNLVIGTYGDGVYWFDSDGKPSHLSSKLSHTFILSLVVDREGCLWIGTNGGGLNRVKRKAFEVLARTIGSTVQSVCEDRKGNLWIGYHANAIDFCSQTVTQQFSIIPDSYESSVKSSSYVKAVFVDQNERVLVGMSSQGPHLFYFENGAFRKFPGSDAINQNVSAIFQDHQGILWVGTQGGLARWDGRDWETFTHPDGLSASDVRAISEDREGNLWIGTDGGGLNRLRDGHFTSFGKTNGLPSNSIASLYLDKEGVLWIGTSGGLVRYQGGKWTRYSQEQGLIGDSVGYMIEDQQGFLWLGSTAGLLRVQKKSLNDFASGSTKVIGLRAYSEADGLPASECTFGSQPAALRSRDGRLWFPTIHGLASVNPAQLSRNTNQPPVVIEAVFIGGQLQNTNRFLVGQLKEVIIPAGEERLDINYSSLNLSGAERARFKYRMQQGHEIEWTPAGDSRTAQYPKLPPGKFTFQVTACNEDEVWNEKGSTLAVTVLPPFWQKPWFVTVSALCLLALIVGSVHFASTQKLQRQLGNLKQQEALEKERARIARDLHDQLGANLTQVALLGELAQSDKDSPQEVQAHAEQICQTALETTHALDEIVWTVNPSNDTLDGLINYICKYAQDYLALAGLRYRLDVPAQLPTTPISPELRHNVFLAAKEAVNNVVKHAKATAASIRLRLDHNRFTLEIEDNGRGMAGLDEKAAQTRNGLRNMRKRMEDVGGEFSIAQGSDGGAVVRLSAPLGSTKIS